MVELAVGVFVNDDSGGLEFIVGVEVSVDDGAASVGLGLLVGVLVPAEIVLVVDGLVV